MENSTKNFESTKIFLNLEPVPFSGWACNKCKQETLVRNGRTILFKYSGQLNCTNCGNSQSLLNYIFEKTVQVEPIL